MCCRALHPPLRAAAISKVSSLRAAPTIRSPAAVTTKQRREQQQQQREIQLNLHPRTRITTHVMWTAARRSAITGATTATQTTSARLLTTTATAAAAAGRSSKAVAWSLCRCAVNASLHRLSTAPLFPSSSAASSAASAVTRRALHSGASASASASGLRSPSLASSDDLPIILTPLPTAASFDAPLPTLAAPERIDPSELIVEVGTHIAISSGGCARIEHC